MKTSEKPLSSQHLKKLQRELNKIEKAEDYLEKERKKLIDDKQKVRLKIKKEKQVLELKNKIKNLKSKRI